MASDAWFVSPWTELEPARGHLLLPGSGERGSRPLEVRSHHFPIGRSELLLEEYRTRDAGLFTPCLLVLHADEVNARAAALLTIAASGGRVLAVRGGRRNVSLRRADGTWRADPNRIFTPRGRHRTLQELRPEVVMPPRRLLASLAELARAIVTLATFEAHGVPWLVAVHTNTPAGSFSIERFLAAPETENDPGILAGRANPGLLPRSRGKDLCLTTSAELFHRLTGRTNVVLQRTPLPHALDDGSLSVWAGLHGRNYLNVETEAPKYRLDREAVLRSRKLLDVALGVVREGL